MSDKNMRITGLMPGTTYYVQARSVSKDDPSIKSDWSAPYKFTTTTDTVAPAPVTNLTLVPEGSSFIAKWDEPTTNADGSSLTDLYRYKVQFQDANDLLTFPGVIYTTDNSIELTFERNIELFGEPKPNIRITVTAQDFLKNTSDEVFVEAQNPPPPDIASVTAESGLESIIINWDEVDVEDLKSYHVYIDTSAAGFTPTEANLKFRGIADAFTFPTFNDTPHYIQVYAVDIFNQLSVNPAEASATPRLSTSTDNTPPGVPTSVNATSSNDGISSSAEVTWVSPGDSDIETFTVRYGTDNATWSYVSTPADVTQVNIDNLKAGTDYYFGVRANDFSANSSAFASATTYPITTAADTTAPNKPSAPTVSTSVQKALVSHDMQDSTATDLPEDMSHLEIHAGTTAGFSITSDTKVGEISYVGPGIAVSSVYSYASDTDLYWKVVAVDLAGNKSVASDATVGTPGLIEGAFIADATIGDAKIQNLSAAKLEAGTAFINDLFVRSGLTIDDVNGFIESDDYDEINKTGWRIDRDGIDVFEGSINAAALSIQNSPNVISPVYASFEFDDNYYFDSSTSTPNSISISTVDGNVRVETGIIDPKFGNKYLNFYSSDSNGLNRTIYLGGNDWRNSAKIEPNLEYIGSAYVRNNTANPRNLSIGLEPRNESIIWETHSIPANSDWVRVSVVADSLSSNEMKVAFRNDDNVAFDWDIDGIQLEYKMTNETNPSPWSPPGSTEIVGEAITTGSIKSSAPAVGVTDQPAWSLNTEGNAQFGDVLVRGDLTVGAGADTTNSVMRSANYVEGSSGWIVRGDGTVEFNAGTFRSNLLLETEDNGLDIVLKAAVEPIDIKHFIAQNTLTVPMISGTSYGYDRTLTNGSYLPSSPNDNYPMNFKLGATADRAITIQWNDKEPSTLFTSVPPRDTLLSRLTVGEQPDYNKARAIREPVGFETYNFLTEERDSNLAVNGTINTEDYLNTNFVQFLQNLDLRSAFKPEVNGQDTHTYSGASSEIISQSEYSSPQKNFIPAPQGNLKFNSTQISNPVVLGTGSLGRFGGSTVLTATGREALDYDENYIVPAVEWNFGTEMGVSNGSTSIEFSPANVNNISVSPNTTYIFSCYIDTTNANAPVNNFTYRGGARANGSTNIQWTNPLTLTTGSKTRMIFPFTTSSGTTNIMIAIGIFRNDGGGNTTTNLNNKSIFVARPMLERKIWGNDPNPEIASSVFPTGWQDPGTDVKQWVKATAGLYTKSNADHVFEAYSRFDPNFEDDYAVQGEKRYREAPAYYDILFERSHLRSAGSYPNETDTTRFRFSEAGLSFPGSYEPFRPASIEVNYQPRDIASGTTVDVLSDHSRAVPGGALINGEDIVQLAPDGFRIDRTGFYVLSCRGIARQDGGTFKQWWLRWMVNTFNFAEDGPKAAGWALNSTVFRFFNRGDVVRVELHKNTGYNLLVDGLGAEQLDLAITIGRVS